MLMIVAAAAAAAAYALGMPPWWCLVAAAAAPPLLLALPRFIAGALHGAATPRPDEEPTTAMSGTEFEDFVAGIARRAGVPVIMTPLTGDWGVDLILGRRPDRVAVQCKRLGRPVGPGAVQEVVAGAPMQDCTRTMVVSNQEFTPAARRLAEQHGCILVGGSQLPRLRAEILRVTAPTAG
ncbi:restriction endonuclease [Mycobacterium sp. MS1601]|uniref:restriction endonuclease n=1 Tax=Mycobacterium sp. MS1601 TaxID=1936029 RepID=UPI0012F909CC